MGSAICDFGATAWLAALFGVEDPITEYWIALASDEPGPGADGTVLADLEPTDSAYHRQHYDAGPDNWATSDNVIANLADIDFGFPLADWGMQTHFVLCSAVTEGDLYAYGLFVRPVFVEAGVHMIIPPGGALLTLSSQDDSITV